MCPLPWADRNFSIESEKKNIIRQAESAMTNVIWHENAEDEKLSEIYGSEIRCITVFKHFKLIYIIEAEEQYRD